MTGPSERDEAVAAGKLTRTEFAVVRAYAQGMRAVDIANRYLLDPDEEDDLTEHQAVQRILKLRDRLVQFALQNDRPDIAAMFDSLKGRSNVAMDRRVDALSSLERLEPGKPLLSHAVSLWFGPSLSRRLTAGGITSVGDLVTLVNRRGSAWWRRVPRLGAKSAGTIVQWLVRHRHALRGPAGGEALEPHIVMAVSAGPGTVSGRVVLAPGLRAPVPLERMAAGPQHATDGSAQLAADLVLVRAWLARKPAGGNTWISYRRECERLLLWAAVNGRSLRSLRADDMLAYLAFLADPQPSGFWCGPASPRDRSHWRPFEKGLSPASRAAALRVVRALCKSLVRDGVMATDPCAGIAADAGGDGGGKARPSAPLDDMDPGIAHFRKWLLQATHSPSRRAANAVVHLLGDCGMRLSEVAQARYADLVREGSRWQVSVRAKSSARSCLAVSEPTLAALRAHWADRPLPPERLAGGPLVGPVGMPPTTRALAKAALREDAGYSLSGLNQLVRSAWREFIEYPEHIAFREYRFTPRALSRG
jgi:site-specific recombinase XerD